MDYSEQPIKGELKVEGCGGRIAGARLPAGRGDLEGNYYDE